MQIYLKVQWMDLKVALESPIFEGNKRQNMGEIEKIIFSYIYLYVGMLSFSFFFSLVSTFMRVLFSHPEFLLHSSNPPFLRGSHIQDHMLIGLIGQNRPHHGR